MIIITNSNRTINTKKISFKKEEEDEDENEEATLKNS